MAKPLVSDELWARIEPLLPPEKPRRFRFPGRRPIDRRKVLTGIIFVLKTGIAWDDLPAELGWGCGRTCRETLAAWQRAGVWDRLHEIAPGRAGRPGADRLVARPDRQCHLQGPEGGRADRPEPDGPPQEGEQAPRDHRRPRGPAGDRADRGPAPRHDADAPAGRRDPADQRPAGPAAAAAPIGSRATGRTTRRRTAEGLRKRGIEPVLAQRGTPHGSGLGKTRWYVERTLSWLHQYGRLRVRWDRLPEVQRGWMALACSLICLRLLL